MEEEQMKILADALWDYFLPKIKDYLSDSLCYYRATVTTAPSGGEIGVQRAFDNAITLPYAWSAEGLSIGDTCLVIVFGEATNAIVIGDGALTAIPSPIGRQYTFTFESSDWTSFGTAYTLTLSAATHQCGLNPSAEVFTLNGTTYERFHSYPSLGWKMSIDSAGDITITTETAFSGKIVVR